LARDIAAQLLTALGQTVLRPAILVSIDSSTGPVRVWSGMGTLNWPASPAVPWTGLGELGGISSIEETRDVRAEGIKLTLSGIPAAMVSLALSDAEPGREVNVYLAAFTDAGEIIADPYLAFSGETDAINLVEGGDSSTLEVAAESELIRLQRANESRFTHEDQQYRFPGDLGFEYVEQLQEFNIQFGPQGDNVPIGQKLVSRRR
jgi:hypothetical protein